MDALAITHRLLRGNYELGIRITLGLFSIRIMKIYSVFHILNSHQKLVLSKYLHKFMNAL